jgi:hypothetical protein
MCEYKVHFDQSSPSNHKTVFGGDREANINSSVEKDPDYLPLTGVRSAEKSVSHRNSPVTTVPFQLSRVVSFSGFDLYKSEKPDVKHQRQLTNHLRNRNELMSSQEFRQYRLEKMIETIDAIIAKLKTKKRVNSYDDASPTCTPEHLLEKSIGQRRSSI